MNRRNFIAKTTFGIFGLPFVNKLKLLDIPSKPVIPKRKLKVVWTVETEQELLAYYGPDCMKNVKL